MFRSMRAREHEALGPLLAIARAKSAAARKAWLDDIRPEAPTVVARLEQLLAETEAPIPVAIPDADAGVRRSPAVSAPTAVPASRTPYWTSPPPRQLGAPRAARAHHEAAAASAESLPRYVAPSLAVGGLRR